MLLERELTPSQAIRFVGPRLPTDDERLQPGAIFVVETVAHGQVTVYPQAAPRDWLRLSLHSGALRRFEVYDPMLDRMHEDQRQRDALVEEYYERYREPIDAWTERNVTPEEREQRAKQQKVGEEMAAMQDERFSEPQPTLLAEGIGGGDPFDRAPSQETDPYDRSAASSYDPYDAQHRQEAAMTPEQKQRVRTWHQLQRIKLEQQAKQANKAK